MMRPLRLILCLGVFSLAFGAAAPAATITFSPQPAGHPVFVSDSEGGFTVVPIAGSFTVGDFFGNPVPDIYDPRGTSTVQVTRDGGGDFEFTSVDLANLFASPGTYSIVGLLSGATHFSSSGTIAGLNTFSTYDPGAEAVLIDTLDITLTAPASGESDIDNIVVNAVATPELPSLVLLGTGIAGFAAAVRRRIFV